MWEVRSGGSGRSESTRVEVGSGDGPRRETDQVERGLGNVYTINSSL